MRILLLSSQQACDRLLVADIGRRLASAWPARGATLMLHEVGGSDGEDLGVRARETTDAIARRLIEEGVSAVSVQGSDRRMLTADGRGVAARSLELVLNMARLGAIPVMSVIAETEAGGVESVSMYAAAAAIARTVEHPSAVLFTPSLKKGLYRDGVLLDELALADLSEFGDVLDVEGVSVMHDAGCLVWVTNTPGLVPDGSIEGTRILLTEEPKN